MQTSAVEYPHLAEMVKTTTVEFSTVSRRAYSVLREAIVSGAIPPGKWLRQELLAETLGISRVPVRTALLQLEAEGLVTFHPFRGARVRTLSPAQIDEIFRLRSTLETLALQLAIPRVRMDQARLATIRQLAITLDRKPTGIDLVGIREQFYRELYDVDQNPMLIELIEQLRGHVGRYLFGFWIEVEHDQTHRHLVELIASGDLPGAQSWCIRHLDEVRRSLLANLLDDRSDNRSVAAATV